MTPPPLITELRPADAAAVTAALAVRNAARAHDVPDLPPICPHRFLGEMTYDSPYRREEHAVARSGDHIVAHLVLVLPLLNNRDSADAEITVHPQHRRRGIGRALFEFATTRLRQLDRHQLGGLSIEPATGNSPGHGFATALGARPVLDELRYRLDLRTIDSADHARQLTDAHRAASDYRLVSWQNQTPPEHLADAAYLVGRLSTDAPSGDSPREPEQMDIDRVRETERGLGIARYHTYLTGAVHVPSGRLVALTMLARAHSVPHHCSQWITIVDPEHRGHRLGQLVKLANLRHLRDSEPDLWVIDTWTAADNHHMTRINTALGFQPVDTWVNWLTKL